MSRYLDFDTILYEEERVPCKFLLDAAHLGHLHPTVTEEFLPKDTELELPLWLAQSLRDKNMVELELPKHYRTKMRDAIAAGAGSVDLREYSFYFYDVGLRLSRLLRDEDLLRTLRRAFCGERFRDLLVHSLSSSHDDLTDYCHKLTSTELTIFNEGLATSRDISRWRSSESSILQKASILGKRGRTKESAVGSGITGAFGLSS